MALVETEILADLAVRENSTRKMIKAIALRSGVGIARVRLFPHLRFFWAPANPINGPDEIHV
jgi:hypothetical protein